MAGQPNRLLRFDDFVSPPEIRPLLAQLVDAIKELSRVTEASQGALQELALKVDALQREQRERAKISELPRQPPRDTILHLVEDAYQYNDRKRELLPNESLVAQAFLAVPVMSTETIVAKVKKQSGIDLTPKQIWEALKKMQMYFPEAVRRPEKKGEGGFELKIVSWEQSWGYHGFISPPK